VPLYFLGASSLIGIVSFHLDSLPVDFLAGVDTFQAESETFLGCSILIPEYLIHSLRIRVGYVESAGSLLDGIALLVDQLYQLPPLVIRQPPVLLYHALSSNYAKLKIAALDYLLIIKPNINIRGRLAGFYHFIHNLSFELR
jgi:hypothetical protein